MERCGILKHVEECVSLPCPMYTKWLCLLQHTLCVNRFLWSTCLLSTPITGKHKKQHTTFPLVIQHGTAFQLQMSCTGFSSKSFIHEKDHSMEKTLTKNITFNLNLIKFLTHPWSQHHTFSYLHLKGDHLCIWANLCQLSQWLPSALHITAAVEKKMQTTLTGQVEDAQKE